MNDSIINNWLQNPSNYETGLKLIDQYSDDNILKQILALGPTQYNQEKLYEALQEIANELEVQPEDKPQITPSFQQSNQYVPEEICELDDGWKSLNNLCRISHVFAFWGTFHLPGEQLGNR